MTFKVRFMEEVLANLERLYDFAVVQRGDHITPYRD
jgi:hypothetical protein